jgi:hypothetical protein
VRLRHRLLPRRPTASRYALLSGWQRAIETLPCKIFKSVKMRPAHSWSVSMLPLPSTSLVFVVGMGASNGVAPSLAAAEAVRPLDNH